MEAAPTPTPPRPGPVRQGIDAAKANLLPGLALWAVAAGIVIAYYAWPWAGRQLEWVAQRKEANGLLFAMVSMPLFGGVIPLLIQQFLPLGDIKSPLRQMPFFIFFWMYKGIEVDLLYRGQAWLWGSFEQVQASHGLVWGVFTVVIPKVFIDQFIYVPIWAVPSMVVPYLWKDLGYSLSATRQRLKPGWYRRRAVPLLLSNWAVWIPAVTLIYCLPTPLQFPVQNLVMCMFALLVMFVTARQATHD